MKINEIFISPLGPVINQFVLLKQALGRCYDRERRILQSLDKFLADNNINTVNLTPEAFTRWCSTLYHLRSGVRRNHMRIVHNLCLYIRRTDPLCFVPDKAIFPPEHQPIQPYIFTNTDVVRLLRATRDLLPTFPSPLYPEVLRLAIVLLFTTGIRRGELINLNIGDYDSHEQTLFIRDSKFHKSRLLPLSKDGASEVENFLQKRRTKGIPSSNDKPLLWNGYFGGRGYSGTGLGSSLRTLFKNVGIRKPDGRLPRVHDFRHAFAVNALLRWYREGADVHANLPLLATYMGHISIVSTEYYLHFIEEISTNASYRFEKCYGKLVNSTGNNTTGGEL